MDPEMQALFEAFTRAYMRADPEAMRACTTDDFDWQQHVGDGEPTGQVIVGVDAVCAEIARRKREWQDVRYGGFHNVANSPVEMLEQDYPITFLRYGLVPDSGGEGRTRGGRQAATIRSRRKLRPHGPGARVLEKPTVGRRSDAGPPPSRRRTPGRRRSARTPRAAR